MRISPIGPMTGTDEMILALRCWSKITLVGFLTACSTPPAQDLETFLQRRAACDHARGEFPDPPDDERMREVEHQVAKYCTGTDSELAALKCRYRLDAAVSNRLAAFETYIEKAVK